MPYAVWNGTAHVNDSGDARILSSPTVTVTDKATGSVATVYEDRDGNTSLGNPFTGGSNGEIEFYVASGRYRIEATDGTNTATWDDVLVGTAQGYDVAELQALASSGVYEDTDAGLSDTSDTEYFWVPESGELVLYQNDAGTAVEQSSYPDQQTVNAARDAAEQAGNVYASTSDGLADTSDGDYFTVPESGRLVLYLNDDGTAVEQLKYAGPIGTGDTEVPTNADVADTLATVPTATDTGTDAYEAALGRAFSAGEKVTVDIGSANGTATPELANTSGTPGSLPITTKDGSALWAGALEGVHTFQLNSGASAWLALDLNTNLPGRTGEIISRLGDAPADDEVVLDGANYLKEDLPELWSYASNSGNLGTADASFEDIDADNFRVPDLVSSERFLRAVAAADVGREQADEFRSHNHGGGDHTHTFSTWQSNGGNDTGSYAARDPTSKTTDGSGTIIDTEGGAETRPINTGVLPCMKAGRRV